MESNPATTTTSPDCISKKLMDIFRVVYYMLRKSISKRKLMMDLNSLLKQSKLAGKALTKLLTHHHHHHHHNHSTHSHHHHHSSFSCRSMDPAASFYNPQEVEFSYTPTPQLLPKLRSKNHRNKKHYDVYNYETAAAIAKAFEMLNNNNNNNSNSNSSSYNINDPQASDDDDHSVLPSPSPLMFGIGKSPIMVRQLRITDSPFPIEEDDKVRDGKVDKEADDFIRRFYEQLKMQKGTPEYNFRRG